MKSRLYMIYFLQYCSYPIVLKFCTEHDNDRQQQLTAETCDQEHRANPATMITIDLVQFCGVGTVSK